MSSPAVAVRAVLTVAAGALLLSLTAGCTGAQVDRPKTYAVKGKVVRKDGTPVRGGTVEFRSTADRTYTMIGQIEQDGTFTLNTLDSNGKMAGAVEGEHEVTIIPDQAKGQGAPPIRYPNKVKVSAGGANEIVLTLPSGPTRP
jgi:hypothetical protein